MMRLVSVQIGTPRTVGVPGASDRMEREFTSAIWKSPVAGPVRVGGWKPAREQGLSRAEGKEYVVQDGDVMLFRFS